MNTQHPRGATSNTSTIVIIIAAVVVGALLIVGCFGAIIASLTLPAIAQARDAARGVMSGSHLMSLNFGYELWREQAGPDAEFTREALIDAGWILPEMLRSPHGPVPDGGEDYWLLVDRPELEPAENARLIVGYDRAMYATQPTVAVVFADGRVEQLGIPEFEQWMGSIPNNELDFNLPARVE